MPQQDIRADRLDLVQGTPTPTVTGTPPSATPTRTPGLTATATNTPSPTPTVCGGGQYLITPATGTVVPGTTDIGNHCDDCSTLITLPFAYSLYDHRYTQARVTSNGLIGFALANESGNICLPDAMARTMPSSPSGPTSTPATPPAAPPAASLPRPAAAPPPASSTSSGAP